MKLLKSLLLGTAAGLLGVAAAQSADIPAKAPVASPVAPYSWTGFYIGANVGYGWSDADFGITPTGAWVTTAPASIPSIVATNKTLRSNGVVAGGQVGYNHQIGRMVVGIENDFAYYNAQTTFGGGPVLTTLITRYTQQASQTWLATARGRLGLAFDRWLVYGTGGLAVSKWNVVMNMTSLGADAAFSSDKTVAGWTAGGGVEFAINRNWSAKAEYLYADFGRVTGSSVFPSPPNGPNFTHDHSVRLVTQVARAGINYKFAGP